MERTTFPIFSHYWVCPLRYTSRSLVSSFWYHLLSKEWGPPLHINTPGLPSSLTTSWHTTNKGKARGKEPGTPMPLVVPDSPPHNFFPSKENCLPLTFSSAICILRLSYAAKRHPPGHTFLTLKRVIEMYISIQYISCGQMESMKK